MSYPKWIQRSADLGPVLAANESEEADILAHWKKYKAAVEKEAKESQKSANKVAGDVGDGAQAND